MMKHVRTSTGRVAFGAALVAAWLSLTSCCCTTHCDTSSAVHESVTAPMAVAAVAAPSEAAPLSESLVKTGDEALKRLMEGNRRFVAFNLSRPNDNPVRRASLSSGQQPFATIFSCVDSRVPPELVFDRGLGDLFVTRTAGQVPDRAVLGSIEYGAEHLHIPLLMVLGHSACGAVKATIETVEKNGHPEGNIAALVDGIRPAVEQAKRSGGEIVDASIRANVALTVERLKHEPALAEMVKKGELKVVGAVYKLDTGEVEVTVP